ncbi:hypothetical protein [Arenimonas sp.]|uniref:hypothetical protein n=1 Tax=Arenimonas sp. TaxID=1872635 RepID=UPI0025C58787|nr:hypothetical protein [Arenimonas sp.]
MECTLGIAVTLLAVGTACFSPALEAGSGHPKPGLQAEAASGPLSPAERGAMTRAFVRKWGPYVQQVYGVPVDAWAQRMVSTFIHADPDNFRDALRRTTYEGATAALNGAGSRASDDQVIDSMARASLDPRLTDAQVGTQALGSAASDLVFTPVTPCRILDTRVAGGQIASDGSRDFNAVVGGGGNFTSQGGSATDCGMVAAGQAAVVINLTAVTPSSAGFATAYPFGAARPLASSVNYTAGAVVNNAIVVKLPTPLTSSDFTIYTFAGAHFVADIVGFYSAPMATALQCTSVDGALRTLTAGEYALLSTVNCPTGYSAVSTSITASQDVVMADSYVSATSVQIFVKNVSSLSQQAIPKAVCCRVPGR